MFPTFCEIMAKKFLVDLRLKARLKAWICQISTNSSADDAALTTDSILASTALPQDERFCVHDFNWLRVNDLTRKLLIVGVETLPENIIACILLEDLDGFMQMEEVTQFFGTIVSRRNSYSPTYLEVCMARTNSGWCRAVYLGYAYGNNDLILDSCKVYCIDYGIVCIIPQIDIRVCRF